LTAGWYYDQFSNFYTFVPSRSWFWSPYGFGFFNNYRDCNYYTPNYSGGNYRDQGGNASGAQVSPRVVSGNDRGAVTRSTDRRSVDTGFESRSGRYGDSGSYRGDSSSSSSSSSTSGPRGTPERGGASRESGGQRGGGAQPSRPRGH
jgi:hypothetical protein